jgi:hypothetical protein
MPERRKSGVQSVKIDKLRQFTPLDLRHDLLKPNELGMAMYELADELPLSHSSVSASLKTKDKCDRELEIVYSLHVGFLF